MDQYDRTRERNLSHQYATSPNQARFLNPDESIEEWVGEHQRYRHPPGDSLKDGFAPTEMTTTDFTIIRHQGLFHLYGNRGFPGCFPGWPGQYEYLFHATTPNLISWTVHGIAMQPHPDHEYECAKIWPPFVFSHNDGFVMVYCGLDVNNCQCLCLATSDDLFEWRRFSENPIVDPRNLEWTLKRSDRRVRHCRDPHVEKIGDTHYLYYATVCEDGYPAVGLSASDDLRIWHDLGPCFKRKQYWVPESPLVIHREEKYFLWVLPNQELHVSDDPTDFHGNKSVPVRAVELNRIVAPEIIDRRYEDKYLIGFYGHRGRRISIGIMAWEKDEVVVTGIETEEQLEPWSFS